MPLYFSENPWKLDNSGASWSYSSAGDTMRFEVRSGDVWSVDTAIKERSEIKSLAPLKFDTAYTLSFDLQIEAGAQNTAEWLNLLQIRGTPDLNETAVIPPLFALHLQGEKLGVVIRSDTAAITGERPADTQLFLDTDDVVRGAWMHFDVQLVFDHQGDGLVKVWRDGDMLVNYSGPLGYNDQVGPYLKLGIYREAADETIAAQFRSVDLDATPGMDTSVPQAGVLSITPLDMSQAEGHSGATSFTFMVVRSGDTSAAASVSYKVAGSGESAASAADFFGGVFPTGRIGFEAGEASKSLTLKVVGDKVVEGNEGFTVTLLNPIGADLGAFTANAIIKNDDAVVQFGSGSVSKLEGATAGTTALSFNVYRVGDLSQESIVGYAVASSGGVTTDAGDFAGGVAPQGTITFAQGESTKTISVAVAGDSKFEGDEVFDLNLVSATNATIGSLGRTSGVIIDDDAPLLSFGSTSATRSEGVYGEATYFTFNLYRSGDLSGVSSASYKVVGLGANPATSADFVGGAMPTGSVYFDAGESAKTITIQVCGDSKLEVDEEFQIQLSDLVGAGLGAKGTAQAVIVNDDAATQINLSSNAVSLSEGGAGAISTMKFYIYRSGDTSSTVTTQYSVIGVGTNPTSASDFQGGVSPSGSVTFVPGETSKTILIPIAGDVKLEGHETFDVVLSSPSGATFGNYPSARGTILNDDASTQISLRGTTIVKAEGGSAASTTFSFSVSRSGDLTGSSSALYGVIGSGGSQASSADFVGGALPTGVVNFSAGEAAKTILVTVAGDLSVEGDETFQLRLSSPTGASLGATTTALGVIQNDDAATQLSFSSSAVTRIEGTANATQSYIFTVVRTGDTTVASSASYTVVGSGASPVSASDFVGNVLPSGTVSFAAGESSKAIVVDVLGDVRFEADETFDVVLSNLGGASFGARPTAQGVIVNDDAATQIAFGSSAVSKAEGAAGATTTITFNVYRTGDLTVSSTANYVVTGNGSKPVAASDFAGDVLPSGVVSFAPGEATKAISLQLAGDSKLEADEGFLLALNSPTGASLGAITTAQGVILNDDTPSLSFGSTVVSKTEGVTGATTFNFNVYRTGDTSLSSSATFEVSGYGVDAASANDFANGFPSGTVYFATGQTTSVISIQVAGDSLYERDEGFAIRLTPADGAMVGRDTATAIILNDDPAPSDFLLA